MFANSITDKGSECLSTDNCKRNSISNEIFINFILYYYPVSPFMQPSIPSSENGTAQRILESDKSNEPPTLSQTFKILVHKSDRWRNIGLLLDLDDGILGKIDAEYRGIPDNCLREMLSLWLKQVNPQPTRNALAEAVKVYDPKLAEQILN